MLAALDKTETQSARRTIRIERTEDAGLIRGVMTHPQIYPNISDDASPPAEEFQPVMAEALWYVAAYVDDELMGVFALFPQNGICWEVHTCLLPKAWGRHSRMIVREGIRWVFENTPCKRIITNVPEYNRLALKLACDAGMKMFGVNKGSFQKNWVLYDQYLLGLSPEEVD